VRLGFGVSCSGSLYCAAADSTQAVNREDATNMGLVNLRSCVIYFKHPKQLVLALCWGLLIPAGRRANTSGQ
jgi:hypothetical protein